ncbi:hypothetical protein YPPY36_1892, partial [Yersinia pestis PY-36]
MKVILGYGFDL